MKICANRKTQMLLHTKQVTRCLSCKKISCTREVCKFAKKVGNDARAEEKLKIAHEVEKELECIL